MNVVRRTGTVAGALALTEAALIYLGRVYGSTAVERGRVLPGDEIVTDPKVVTDHAVTIDAPPGAVWPWLVQMGWGRGGWYTARWVDRLLFPANGPSADRIIPELQHIEVGTYIPDGPPETECGLYVEVLHPERALVLHSNSHLPRVGDPGLSSTGRGRSCSPPSTTAAEPGSSSAHAGRPIHGGSPSEAGSASSPPTSSCPECGLRRAGGGARLGTQARGGAGMSHRQPAHRFAPGNEFLVRPAAVCA